MYIILENIPLLARVSLERGREGWIRLEMANGERKLAVVVKEPVLCPRIGNGAICVEIVITTTANCRC